MIHSVKIINYIGQELDMKLRNPEESGFLIFNMAGIGPGKSDINVTSIVTADGGVYNSSRLPPRNIVLSLRFFSNARLDGSPKTAEDIRLESYKYFPVKRPVTLRVTTDNRVAEIVGYVESNEPVVFSKETHTQLSIICPDPYFYSQEKQVVVFAAVNPLFEFPFSNESLDEPLIIMGEVWPEATRSVWYEGDAEVGVIIHIFAKGIVSELSIFNVETDERMVINNDRMIQLTGSGIVAGDHIIISTIRGDKHISLIRRGVKHNILNVLNRDAYWFQLRKGDNIFGYIAEFGLSNIDFQIEHRVAYEGV